MGLPIRRGGRKALFKKSCKVFLLLDAPMYDHVYAVSRERRISVPEVIRRSVALSLRHINFPPASNSGTVDTQQ